MFLCMNTKPRDLSRLHFSCGFSLFINKSLFLPLTIILQKSCSREVFYHTKQDNFLTYNITNQITILDIYILKQ